GPPAHRRGGFARASSSGPAESWGNRWVRLAKTLRWSAAVRHGSWRSAVEHFVARAMASIRRLAFPFRISCSEHLKKWLLPYTGCAARQSALARNYFELNLSSVPRIAKKYFGRAIL